MICILFVGAYFMWRLNRYKKKWRMAKAIMMGEGEGTESAMFNDKYGIKNTQGSMVMMSPNPRLNTMSDPAETKKLKQMQEDATREKDEMANELARERRKLEQMKKELAMANVASRRPVRRNKTKKSFDPTSAGRLGSPSSSAVGGSTKYLDTEQGRTRQEKFGSTSGGSDAGADGHRVSKLPAMESAEFDTSGAPDSKRDSLTKSHAAASSRFDDDSEDPPLVVSVEESERDPHAPKKVSVSRLSL